MIGTHIELTELLHTPRVKVSAGLQQLFLVNLSTGNKTHMSVKQAKFNIGQIVLHSESGYRGVVVDIDPEFSRKAMDV